MDGSSRGGGQKETCARSKNYPNPWDLAASSGVESRQPKVPWVNESATPGEWLHPRASRYVYGLPPQGWLLARSLARSLAWTPGYFSSLSMRVCIRSKSYRWAGITSRAFRTQISVKPLLRFVITITISPRVSEFVRSISSRKLKLFQKLSSCDRFRSRSILMLMLVMERNSPAHHFVSKKDPTHFRIFILSLVHDSLK